MNDNNLRTEEAVLVWMVDRSRGDLFLLIAKDRHFGVQLVGDSLDGADEIVHRPGPGRLSFSRDGVPIRLTLTGAGRFSNIRLLECNTSCPSCSGIMKSTGIYFECRECGEVMK